MNGKRNLTALLLTLCLFTHAAAFASGAPSSQFGFKGWPYRQSDSCAVTICPKKTPPAPTEVPTPEPTVTPAPTATPTPEPTLTPAPTATSTPKPTPTPAPTATPTPEPTVTPAPTATSTPKPTVSSAPTATSTPKPTVTPAPTATPTPEPTLTPAPTVTSTPKPTPTPAPTEVPPFTDEDYTTGSITAQEENAFLLLNQDRAANGRSALELDPALCDLARLKSRDMYLNNYFSHTSPTYGSAAQMLSAYGYAFTSVGENIAHHATVEKAQAAFMSSSGHRQNILGSQWTKVGIGVWEDSQGFVYVTQLFVR